MAVGLVFPAEITAANFYASSTDEEGYEAMRQFYGRPWRPTRSYDPNGFLIILDAGANKSFVIDTICVDSNLRGFIFMADADTSSWGAPTIYQAYTATSRSTVSTYSVAANVVTRTDGITMVPDEYRGCRITNSLGAPVAIAHNGTSDIVTEASMVGATGAMSIFAPRNVYAVGQRSLHQYIQIGQGVESTSEGYFEIRSVVLGTLLTLGAQHKMRMNHFVPGYDSTSQDGARVRRIYGDARREWILNCTKMSLAEYKELKMRLMMCGEAPLALIPNTSDTTDWSLCLPDLSVEWAARSMTIRFIEV